MKCYNCGYINFQRTKKCPSCNTSLKGTQSHVELAQDPQFTVFAGEPPDFGSGYDSGTALLDDEFAVEETISREGDFGLDLDEAEGLDLDEAVSADAGLGEFQESSISPGMASDVGPNDFELDLTEAIAEQIMASSSPTPADADLDLDLEPTVERDAGTDLNIEGVGFDLENVAEPDTVEVATEDLDLDLDTEPKIELPDEEPTLELSEEPELNVDLDTGGGEDIEFALDDDAEPSADLPKKRTDEGGIEFGGLESEETPDDKK